MGIKFILFIVFMKNSLCFKRVVEDVDPYDFDFPPASMKKSADFFRSADFNIIGLKILFFSKTKVKNQTVAFVLRLM